jgi:uncharacterized repeat protein (TIGR01451 family)
MKRRLSVYLSIAALTTVPLLSNAPVWAGLQHTGTLIAQNSSNAKVQLNLGAEKRILKTDAQGKQQAFWQPLKGSVTVQPGDVLRYTLTSESGSQKTAKNFVATQPVPNKTTYILSSAKSSGGATLSFSIDGGKTFAAKPEIKVKLANGKEELRPAPAATYTHIRWNYGQRQVPLASIKASYEVVVK